MKTIRVGALRLLAGLLCAVSLGGCTVLAVVDTAASAAVGVAGVAVDAAVGTVKLGTKAVGKAADAVMGTDSK